MSKSLMENHSEDKEFDLVVSFAGEDRKYVESIVSPLKERGYHVFYDNDFFAHMWGHDLAEYFADTYENKSRFAMMFISEHYARKAWTIHERRSILLRALNQAAASPTPYLLPIRIDDTSLDGLRSSVSYIDSREKSVEEIVESFISKAGEPIKGEKILFNGLVPQTPEEAMLVRVERPRAWEYYLTAYLFQQQVRDRAEAIEDVKNGFFQPGQFVPSSKEAASLCQRELAAMLHISTSFNTLLRADLLEKAWGSPGEPGDAAAIDNLGRRFGQILQNLIDWQARVGSYTSGDERIIRVFATLVRMGRGPMEDAIAFANDFRSDIDGLAGRLEAGESVDISRVLKISMPAGLVEDFNSALQELQ